MQILLIEDEQKLAGAIAEGLKGNGYEVSVARSGEDGLKQLHDSSVDLMLVDLMLPRLSGLEVVREVRRGGYRTPILILTSMESVDDRVRGLDAGADDYLVKPFAFSELLARLRALYRRASPERPSMLQMADLKVDVGACCHPGKCAA